MRPMLLATIAALALSGCERSEPNQAAPAAEAAPVTENVTKPAAIAASFDCARARGQAQELICGDANLAAMDREAARLGGGDSAGHAAWAKARDDCWRADELHHCVMANAMLRIHQLRGRSPSDGDGISAGPVAYRCAGIEGPLTATFFKSDPGAVALQWSGVTVAIEHVLAASGVRYEGRWDGEPVSFWTKGREATLTVSGKGDLACQEIGAAR